MMIEKDGIKYQVIRIVDQKKELQDNLENLQLAVEQMKQIDTTGLNQTVKAVIEKENQENQKIKDSLRAEIEIIKLKLLDHE
jgi:ABC-type transporter Mla MlaB component